MLAIITEGVNIEVKIRPSQVRGATIFVSSETRWMGLFVGCWHLILGLKLEGSGGPICPGFSLLCTPHVVEHHPAWGHGLPGAGMDHPLWSSWSRLCLQVNPEWPQHISSHPTYALPSVPTPQSAGPGKPRGCHLSWCPEGSWSLLLWSSQSPLGEGVFVGSALSQGVSHLVEETRKSAPGSLTLG